MTGVYADGMKARRRKFRLVVLFALLAIGSFLAIAAFTIAWSFDYFGWHSRTKWLLSASKYKTKMMSGPIAQDGSLRHLEWDGWGFPGVGDTGSLTSLGVCGGGGSFRVGEQMSKRRVGHHSTGMDPFTRSCVA